VGDGSTVDVQFLSSGVDMSSGADSTSRGGLYLEGVTYEVAYSGFYYMTDPQGPEDDTISGAAVQAVGGSGVITESLFEDNALAIWASGGSPLISSCSISGAGTEPTYGINLTGGPASPIIRTNLITENSGYGLRIGTDVTPKIRKNVISNNGLSGILIDFGASIDIQNIDLGSSTDWGYNDLFGNTHPGVAPHPNTIEVYVSSLSGSYGYLIPAERNYWGVNDAGLVPSRIYDGIDVGDRARINYNNPFLTQQN
jgi:hypothetical protein